MIAPIQGPGELVQLFWRAFPRAFLADVLWLLHESYAKAAYQAYCDHAAPEAENVLPFLRRARIEEHLRIIAKKFSLKAEARRGTASWWNHTLIESGNVSFTQLAAQSPDEIVRWSYERDQYCADNRQQLLFDKRLKVSRKSLYAILVHGREGKDRAKLGFAMIRFPLPKVAGYYESRIDLLKEFPDIAEKFEGKSSMEPAPPEEILDELSDIDLLRDEDVG